MVVEKLPLLTILTMAPPILMIDRLCDVSPLIMMVSPARWCHVGLYRPHKTASTVVDVMMPISTRAAEEMVHY